MHGMNTSVMFGMNTCYVWNEYLSYVWNEYLSYVWNSNFIIRFMGENTKIVHEYNLMVILQQVK